MPNSSDNPEPVMMQPDLAMLTILSEKYRDVDSALGRAAYLRAKLTLPKGVVHVISDVHGEHKKLRHVINNASGSLRPMMACVFGGRLDEAAQRALLAVIYYPREAMQMLEAKLADPAVRHQWVGKTIRQQFDLLRHVSVNYPREEVLARAPSALQGLFRELLTEPHSGRDSSYVDAMLDTFASQGRDLSLIRAASRLVRNLAIHELIVAGDLGDRGARLDRVIDFLMQQPNVSYVWGNHDVTWMGACLGHGALIATVLRISLRYQRLWQLEEGYGIILTPLEKLVREHYADDPAERFMPHGQGGLRDPLLVARMHKAAAVIEFKLAGQMIQQHPEWCMDDRNSLLSMDFEKGTVNIDGQEYPLLDKQFPTIDPSHPLELNEAERECLARLRESFTSSPRLWQHMSHVVRQGAMFTVRDGVVIFHACVPVDEQGKMLTLAVDGEECLGRRLFEKLETVVRRAFRKGAVALDQDADWFWYLWAGPLSPLFGKDKMTTFERYFVADKAIHKERMNPYFALIHDAAFTSRIAAGFGVSENALVVNGHIPVKVEKGEQPVKRGGNAVTIDGAFSEAYGDRGYTLVLGPEAITLAEHHHFTSIMEAISGEADIVPLVQTLVQYPAPRRIADTEEGVTLRGEINAMEALVSAYRSGYVREHAPLRSADVFS